jgi:hypothetical protein
MCSCFSEFHCLYDANKLAHIQHSFTSFFLIPHVHYSCIPNYAPRSTNTLNDSLSLNHLRILFIRNDGPKLRTLFCSFLYITHLCLFISYLVYIIYFKRFPHKLCGCPFIFKCQQLCAMYIITTKGVHIAYSLYLEGRVVLNICSDFIVRDYLTLVLSSYRNYCNTLPVLKLLVFEFQLRLPNTFICVQCMLLSLFHPLSCSSSITSPDYRAYSNDNDNQYGNETVLCNLILCRYLFLLMNYVSLFNVVGIATSYGLDDRGIGVGVPLKSRMFTSPYWTDLLWGSPKLLINGHRRKGREVDHSSPTSVKVK